MPRHGAPRASSPLSLLLPLLLASLLPAVSRGALMNPRPGFDPITGLPLSQYGPYAHLNSRRRAGPTTYPPNSVVPVSQVAPVCQIPGNATLFISSSAIRTLKWSGWGTSLAWFANYIGGLPTPQLTDFLDFLFSKTKGLGLNIVRYNIGGGFNASLSPQFAVDNALKYRGIPGFRPRSDKGYVWTNDQRQRTVLLGAKARGANIFIAFSNSPPPWMTVSGDVAGGRRGASNLKPAYYQAFADYLADVVLHYSKKSVGVPFQYLEPVNEPDNGWAKGNTQEGCTFKPSEVAALLPLVAASLKRRQLRTKIVVNDGFARSLGKYMGAVPWQVMANVAAFHAHGYLQSGKPKANPLVQLTADFASAAQTAAKYNKELWMTEWGPDAADGGSLGTGLYMARVIIQSINTMRATAWAYWQPIDTNWKWTLINSSWADGDASPYNLTTKFYVLKQFTTLVPRGSSIIDVASTFRCLHCVAAFYVPCRAQLVVVGVNQSPSAQQLSFTIQGFNEAVPGAGLQAQTWRTSATETLAALPPQAVDIQQPLTLTLNPQSLTTVTISKVISVNVAQTKCQW